MCARRVARGRLAQRVDLTVQVPGADASASRGEPSMSAELGRIATKWAALGDPKQIRFEKCQLAYAALGERNGAPLNHRARELADLLALSHTSVLHHHGAWRLARAATI